MIVNIDICSADLKDDVIFERLKVLLGADKKGAGVNAKGHFETLYIEKVKKNLSMTTERIEKFGENREDVARGLLEEMGLLGENVENQPVKDILAI